MEILSAYKYLILLVGLIISGDVLVVPLIYSVPFGFVGMAELYLLVVISSFATDTIWYVIGRKVTAGRVEKFPILRNKPHVIARLSALFDSRRGYFVLFVSKFIYGTRSVTQMLCGVHRMKYSVYLLVGVAGTLIWTTFLVVLISLTDAGVSSLENTATKVQVSLAIVVIAIVAVHFLAKRYFGSWFNE